MSKFNFPKISSVAGTGILLACCFLIFLGTSFYVMSANASKQTDLSKPGQYLYGINVGGKTVQEVMTDLDTAYNHYLSKNTIFYLSEGITVVLDNQSLNPVLYTEDTLAKISYYNGTPSTWQYFKDKISPKKNHLSLNFDLDQVITTIDHSSADIALTSDARFYIDDNGQVMIQAEVNGMQIDHDELLQGLQNKDKIIQLKTSPKSPQVTVSDLAPLKPAYQKLVATPVILSSNDLQFLLDFSANPNLIHLDLPSADQQFKLNSVELSRFVSDNLSKSVEQEPENIQVTLAGNKGHFTGSTSPGIKIDTPELEKQLNEIIVGQSLAPTLKIPTVQVAPTVQFSEELQAKGIKELYATAYTTFDGSPANRIHNIKIGASNYSGLIIPKGETFSFNKNLGEVDAVNGYLPELVIKAEGTIPEFGGGLCQVSTTLYRTAVLGGLKIAERWPHSYAVSYYSQVLGHGLDASIYPGSKDLKIVNDTPGDLLIESYVEGTKITFNFYGTKDGRTVKMDGPVISDKTGVGAPIHIVKNDLAPGTIKQVEKATPGFKAFWTRTITSANGQQATENIFSSYRTVSDKFLVSPDKAPNQPGSNSNPVLPPLDENGLPRI